MVGTESESALQSFHDETGHVEIQAGNLPSATDSTPGDVQAEAEDEDEDDVEDPSLRLSTVKFASTTKDPQDDPQMSGLTDIGGNHRASILSDVGGSHGNAMVNRLDDHFSLEMPSSGVRFRHAHIRVYEQANSQFILEEKTVRDEDGNAKGTRVSVKYASNATIGLRTLRIVYGLVATFAAGFLFIFSIMILLFLFIDLSSTLGLGDRSAAVMRAVALLLSVPIFVYGLSSGMAMVGSFVHDTWNGHSFLRTFGNWSPIITEWVSFTIYIGIPLLTATITLFAKMPDWWELTLITWFVTILLFFGFFAACVLFYDISACLYLIQNVDDPYFGPIESPEEADPSNDNGEGGRVRWRNLRLMRRAVLLRQVDQFSGQMRARYTLAGKLSGSEDINRQSMRDAISESKGPYSRATEWKCWGGLFEPLDPPQRSYTLEEVLGTSPFVTAQSWSLEKFFCMKKSRSRAVAVVHGPAALTQRQIRSSFACAIVGSFFVVLTPTALMVWLNFPGAAIVVVLLILVLFFLPTIKGYRRMYKRYTQMAEQRGESSGLRKSTARRGSVASEGVYQVWEQYRINRPTRKFCYGMFFFEICFLFVWPLIFLLVSQNWPTSILFVILGFFSLVRHYLNASVVLKELGTFGDLGSKNVFRVNLTREDLMDKVVDREWKAKSRLSAIVTSITRGRARKAFLWVFAVVALILLAILVAGLAMGTQTDPAEDARNYNELSDFYYETQPNLPYQTCRMGKGLQLPDSEETALLDVAFISAIAYAGESTTQRLLDGWFGEGLLTNEADTVDAFKGLSSEYVNSAAHYKYITSSRFPDFGVVAVRGTSNAWDALADAQLWGAAILFQAVRAILPVGEAFTPILHRVVKIVPLLETESINKVSYYKEVTAFVETVKNATKNLIVTGHSLGGGVALISGAQTKRPAIGLSAPNAMISRDTFQPPITPLDLNTYTFNIIPNRDPVPRFDDVADLYQRIECRTGASDFFGCHTASRSVCEIMYTCGTLTRPALCICAKKWGYPEPLQKNPLGRTFQEACANATY